MKVSFPLSVNNSEDHFSYLNYVNRVLVQNNSYLGFDLAFCSYNKKIKEKNTQLSSEQKHAVNNTYMHCYN